MTDGQRHAPDADRHDDREGAGRRDMLVRRLVELQVEHGELLERVQRREAELASIRSSRMWRWWMRYHALRRSARVLLSPLLRLRDALRSDTSDGLSTTAGDHTGESPSVDGQRGEADDLEASGEATAPDGEVAPFDPESHRPEAAWSGSPGPAADGRGVSALVLGIYMADRLNNVEDIVRTMAGARSVRVVQRWIALCGAPPSGTVADVTVERVDELTPKGALINAQVEAADLERFDYVVLCDDDVVLPGGFLDSFLDLQERLQFRIAQPARTAASYIDLPIVERHPGLLARQTLFVEQGPVVSFHRSAFDLVFPFDLTSPMGWGLENVWSLRASRRGLKMGIIDAVPVDHSMRKPVANYSWHEADRGRSALFASTEHRPTEACFKVVDVVQLDGVE